MNMPQNGALLLAFPSFGTLIKSPSAKNDEQADDNKDCRPEISPPEPPEKIVEHVDQHDENADSNQDQTKPQAAVTYLLPIRFTGSRECLLNFFPEVFGCGLQFFYIFLNGFFWFRSPRLLRRYDDRENNVSNDTPPDKYAGYRDNADDGRVDVEVLSQATANAPQYTVGLATVKTLLHAYPLSQIKLTGE
jgi:hypothetical protein